MAGKNQKPDPRQYIPAPTQHYCPACNVKGEMIEFLRERVRSLEAQAEKKDEKFLAMVGPAAEQYARLELTRQAQMGGQHTGDMLPISRTMGGEVDEVGDFIDQVVNGGKR